MEITDNKEVKSKRELFLERMKGKYPDKNFDDEEEFYDTLGGEFDAYDEERGKREENDKRINDLFTGNPRFAAFFMDTAGGDSPVVAFIRHFGKDVLEGTDDEEFVSKITEEDSNYKNKVSENKRIEEEQKANLENSQKVFDKFQEDNGLSDEEMDALVESACNKAGAIFMGIFDEETLTSELKAMNHDTDVESAYQEGEIKGRNSKISKEKKKQTVPDGMPAMLGGSGSPKQTPKNETVEALDRITSSQSDIWGND